MPTNWPSVDVPPKILVLPPGVDDLGEAEAACELWEHYSRKRLDDDQRIAVYVMMAQAGGKWAAKTTGREKPRQNGKGDEIEVVELWGLVQLAEAILHTVHDAVMLSTQTQQRMLGVLEGHPDLRRRIAKVWRGTGQQMIEMRNGGCIWYRTRTAKGGLGVDDVDRVVLDEAQEAQGAHIAAISPTMLANPNSQLNALGTSGKTGVSGWWWGVRKRALSADPGAFGYIGTTAESVHLDDEGMVVQVPVDARDRKVWLAVNPAIRAGRGEGIGFLDEQLQRMGEELFAREHLGVWDPPDDEDDSVRWDLWPRVTWEAAATGENERKQAKPGWIPEPSYAVEMPPDRSKIAVGAAGECREGATGIEVVAIDDAGPWLVKYLTDNDIKSVVIDRGGPAAALAPELEAADITVVEAKFDDLKKATGDFYDAVTGGEVIHRNHPDLDASVAAATKRKSGDVWLIDRYGPGWLVNVVALARWGHLQGYEDASSIYEQRGPVVL